VRNDAPAAVLQQPMATRTETSSRRRGATAFAALCAGVLGAAATLAPSADAGNTKPHVLGQTKNTPRALCPQQPSESQNPTTINRPCFVIGSVTGFELKADGERHVMRAPTGGKIVSWAVQLAKPNKLERNAFGAQNFFGTKRYGKEATGRIGVLAARKKGTYKLVRQSPTVKLDQSFGEFHYVTLDKPLKIKKGEVVALTTQTWIPALTTSQYAPQSTWRASRNAKKCNGKANAINATPQTKVGSIRGYGCIFTARLLYWAYYVPGG
jgi:hypothetical protein